MRVVELFLPTLLFTWLLQNSVGLAVPPPPPFASNYQNVWTQDFTTMSSLSVSAQGPCGAGGTTWMAHKPLGGDFFRFSDPQGPFTPFGIGSGYLTIRVQRNGPLDNGFGGYTGGLLASVDNSGRGFAQQYGYFEAAMQLPGGPNTWPAFWLLSLKHVSERTTRVAELDVMEGTGNGDNGPNNNPPGNPNYDILAWHRYVDGSQVQADGKGVDTSKPPFSTNLTTGFHTYGVDVEPSGINWYFDRQLIWSTPIYPEAQEPLFILLNLALGNGNFNNATGTGYDWALTPDPSDLRVQYVAVWASPNSPNYVPTNAPAPPVGLSASAGNAQVSLSWTGSAGATSYNVYLGTTAGGQSATPVANVTGTTYTNSGLTNGTTYYFRIAAVNGFGTSGYSNEASATPVGGTSGVLYQDGFGRSGELVGSAPESSVASGRTWSSTAGNGQFSTGSGSLTVASTGTSYSAAFLPVNGSSGVTLDGTADFTLSAAVTPGVTGQAGISLNKSLTAGSFQNAFSNDLAVLLTGATLLAATDYNGAIGYSYGAVPASPRTLTISYSASASTLRYTVGGTVVRTQTGVTAAQIATVRAVAIGNQGYGNGAALPAPSYDNFTLTVGASVGGTAPPAPTALSASAGNAQVALSWTGSAGATSYNVYLGTTAGGQSATPVANVTGTTYTNSGLTNGTTYYFRVAAVNGFGTSGYSNEASATPVGGTAPPAPTALSASAGNAQVALSWTGSAGATSYNVYLGTTAGGQSATPVANVTGTTYTNSGLTNGTTYYFRIAAVNGFGTSGYSNEASATPVGGTAPPAPTALSASAGNAQVALSWTGSAGATSYNVYLGTTAGGQSATPVANVTGTTYTNSGLTNGTPYYFRVAAVNGFGTSGYSNEASATPVGGTAPPAPTALSASAGNAQVALSWTGSAGATSYNVYLGTTAGGQSATPVANVTGTTYTNSGLTNGTPYYFRVAAVNGFGTSGYSNEASATPVGGTSGVLYQDGFGRSGELVGSAPESSVASGRTWSSTAGNGQFSTGSGSLTVASTGTSYSAAFLPVNGSSGVTLDGTADFTLSVAVTPGGTGQAGISLNKSLTAGSFQNAFSNDLAVLLTGATLRAVTDYNGAIGYSFGAVPASPRTLTISYSASASTLSYTVGGAVVRTQTGVTAAQIATVRAVAIGNQGYGNGAALPAPSYDNFTLTVGP